ncbi:MAG: hypothetical protein QNJ55_35315 [Xenococcus sp. MO_188.B8]|nr:hypothetical protein [Xenococcus sp. MO_188.B8]
MHLHLIEPLETISEAPRLSQEWIFANLVSYSPNLYLVIKQRVLLAVDRKLKINPQILFINRRLS